MLLGGRLSMNSENDGGVAPSPASNVADPRISAQDMLPSVQPPTAGFLMQLFFIPLIIVSIIVLVWLSFSWLAHQGTHPDTLVSDLGRLNHGSWQKAHTLANLLRDPRQERLRRDNQLAARLGAVLQQQLEEGSLDEDRIRLRIYLCRTLGEFAVADGLPALIQASTIKRDEAEADVRRAAIQAIAMLTGRSRSIDYEHQRDDLIVALMGASEENSGEPGKHHVANLIRSDAAYALGVLGGPQPLDRLLVLQNDACPEVRFNAATGLARQGDARSLKRLTEMLDPTEMSVVESETAGEATWKREHVILNGLFAVKRLAELNQEADLEPLKHAIEKLATSSEMSSAIKVQSQDALRSVQTHQSQRPNF